MQKVDMKAKLIRFHNTKFPYKYLHDFAIIILHQVSSKWKKFNNRETSVSISYPDSSLTKTLIWTDN